MKLNQNLYDRFLKKAGQVLVENATIGLGYTAVTVSDGGMGLAGTYFGGKKPESMNRNYVDFEGKPADRLLRLIKDERMVHRCMALALINALNYGDAVNMPQSPGNRFLLAQLGVFEGSNVAMVGFFSPLVEMMKAEKIPLEVLDESLELGDPDVFFKKLSHWADVLILTSTSILNNTAEEILGRAGHGVKTVLMGPSTPMVRDVFEPLGVNMLAGAVPTEKEKVLKAVRHGTGTPVIKQFCKQVYAIF